MPQLHPPRRAAVLVPIITVAGHNHAVFIERSQAVPVHQGDMAFPGGRHHPERDQSLWATALREAEEEIGLPAADVELLYALPEVRTFSSNYVISPFVGRIAKPCEFRPDPREVARVVTLSVAALRDPRAHRTVRRRLSSGAEIDAPAFVVDSHVVWGATQRITVELLRVLP
ncbi:MAG: CoA pyrophosphatase [Deltaproteobacteria bacterium]|nr:CoA pyrophosphatase [Deltaproteobacteria bacterium]